VIFIFMDLLRKSIGLLLFLNFSFLYTSKSYIVSRMITTKIECVGLCLLINEVIDEHSLERTSRLNKKLQIVQKFKILDVIK